MYFEKAMHIIKLLWIWQWNFVKKLFYLNNPSSCLKIFIFIYLFDWTSSYCGMWDLVPWPGNKLGTPALEVWSFSHQTTREVSIIHFLIASQNLESLSVCMLSLFSCVQFCDPKDYSPPGFSVHGILQSRILEWVAMPSFRGRTWVSCIGRWVLYH